jgi:hypothetical protein
MPANQKSRAIQHKTFIQNIPKRMLPAGCQQRKDSLRNALNYRFPALGQDRVLGMLVVPHGNILLAGQADVGAVLDHPAEGLGGVER